jgi:exodeoxyribonuclease VIII
MTMSTSFKAEPGVYPDLPNHVYHCPWPKGVSKTSLCRIARAPLAFRDAIDHPGEAKKSASLTTGSVFHIVMEGAFERDCAVSPPVKDKRQADWKNFVKANPGKICVTPEEAREVFQMREALLRYGPARDILAGPGLFECSFYWTDPVTGLLCKCRPDWISENLLTIIDFKTCQDATEAAFVRSAERYHYHVSAAMTMDGVEAATGIRPDRYVFLAIETASPFLTAAYEATADDIERGRAFVRRNLATLKRCIDNGTWPGLPEEIRALDVARWRGRKQEEETEELEAQYEPVNEWWKQ